MKIRALVTIFAILTFSNSTYLYAQFRLEWSNTHHTSSANSGYNEKAVSLCIDENRNVYVAGVRGTAETELLKYGSNGNLLWNINFAGGLPRRILYAGNNLFLAGLPSLYKIDIDGSAHAVFEGRFVDLLKGQDNYLYAMYPYSYGIKSVKLNFSGDTVWTRFYGVNTSQYYEVTMQFQGVDDKINMFGTVYRSVGGFLTIYQHFLAYASSGVPVYDGSPFGGVVKAVRDDYTNHNFFAGNTNLSVWQSTVLLYKANSSNVIVDTGRYDGPGNGRDEPLDIVSDNQGNIYLACRSWGVSVDYDFVLLKFNTNCELLWEYRYNGSENSFDAASFIKVGSDGNIYASGVTTMNTRGTQIRTVKLSPSGQLLWADNFSASTQQWTSDSNYVNDMQLDNYNNIYICGKTRNKSTRKDDYLTIKYGDPTSVEEGASVSDEFGLFQNYPNPFNPEVTLRFSFGRSLNVKVSVFDALGNKIDEPFSGKVSGGIHEVRWNGGRNSSGVYFFVLEAGNLRSVRKGVLLK